MTLKTLAIFHSFLVPFKGPVKSEKLFSPFWYRLVGLGVTYLKMYAKKIKTIHSVCGVQSKVLGPSPPLFTSLGLPRKTTRKIRHLLPGFLIGRGNIRVHAPLTVF